MYSRIFHFVLLVACALESLSAQDHSVDGMKSTTLMAVACDDGVVKPNLLDRIEDFVAESRLEGSRWARLEYEFDNRGFNVIHFMGNSPLPAGFNLWGFIDIEGLDQLGANREDTARYFLEMDLTRKITRNAGVIAEFNDLQGDNNALGRFGVFYKPDIKCLSPKSGLLSGKGWIGVKAFPIQTDGKGRQLSFNYNKNFDGFWCGRCSVGGFFDLNFNAGSSNDKSVIVSEHQIRVRLVEGLHVLTEFRLNEFLADDFGIAPAIQYRF